MSDRDLEEIRKLTTDVIAGYDERISAVGEIIEKSLEMLDQYRVASQIIQDRLRETLAKAESLRKKDFDFLMAPLLAHQIQRQSEIKLALHSFLKGQRELASRLKRAVQAEIYQEILRLEEEIKISIAEARRGIEHFQREQALIGARMQGLYHKNGDLTLKEFRQVIGLLQNELGLVGNGKAPKAESEVPLEEVYPD